MLMHMQKRPNSKLQSTASTWHCCAFSGYGDFFSQNGSNGLIVNAENGYPAGSDHTTPHAVLSIPVCQLGTMFSRLLGRIWRFRSRLERGLSGRCSWPSGERPLWQSSC